MWPTGERPTTRPLALAALACCALLAAIAVGLLLLSADERGFVAPPAPHVSSKTAPSADALATRVTGEARSGESEAQVPAPRSQAPAELSEAAPTKPARRAPLPKTAEGKVDFAALGLTGKEVGAELLATENEVREAPLQVSWSVGDEWVVETYYRQMQAGDGETWSGPARWKYRVERQELRDGQAVLVFVVRLTGADGAPDGRFPATTFYVSAHDQSLVGADLYNVRGGKGKYTRVAYRADGRPSVAGGSIVPFDLPTRGAMGRLVGGPSLPTLDPISAASRRALPQPARVLGAGQDYLELSFTSPVDGTRVRQRWAAGDRRWPAVSETETRRSYRLR